MATSSVSSTVQSAWKQMQYMDAKRVASQAEARAEALGKAAESAREDARSADRTASAAETKAATATSTAQMDRRNVSSMESMSKTVADLNAKFERLGRNVDTFA